MRHGHGRDDAVLITTAPPDPRQELADRQRRYLITMGIRLVLFIAAVALWPVIGGWSVLVACVSLVLPWVAVVAANAGPKRVIEDPSLYRQERRAIGGSGDDHGPGAPGPLAGDGRRGHRR